MNIDYINKPEESLETLLSKYSLDMYLIIEDVLEDPRGYELVFQQLIDIMKWAFEIEEVRHRPIHFKFHKKDKKIHEMRLNNFISNMVLWYAFMEMDRPDVLNESFIFDFSNFTIKDIVSYLDDRVFPLYEGDFHGKNKIVDEVFHNIRAIANAFCLLMGMSISMYDIWQAEEQNPEISEIIFGKIDPTLQPTEIEQELDRRAGRLMELFSQIDCDLKPLLVSGKNISKGQFKDIRLILNSLLILRNTEKPEMVTSRLLVA